MFNGDQMRTYVSKGRLIESGSEKTKRVKAIPSESKTKKDPKWRASNLQNVNPRSRTYVKEGTVAERVAVPMGAGYIAGPLGTSWGRTKNLRSDSTRSYRRSDGAKASHYIGYADAGMYRHAVKKSLAPVDYDYGMTYSAFGVDHGEGIFKRGPKIRMPRAMRNAGGTPGGRMPSTPQHVGSSPTSVRSSSVHASAKKTLAAGKKKKVGLTDWIKANPVASGVGAGGALAGGSGAAYGFSRRDK